MHRGTTIEDAGYRTKSSWPIVPDLKDARDYRLYSRNVKLAIIPLVAALFCILTLSGVPIVGVVISAVALGIALSVLTVHFSRKSKSLRLNCKMVKVVAENAGVEVSQAADAIFGAICRSKPVEQIIPLTNESAVYVNAGYKMDDGRFELPYIIYIVKDDRKVEILDVDETVEEQAA